MKLPIPIIEGLNSEYFVRWNNYYKEAVDRNRTQEEGIWRRTQCFNNSIESNWSNPIDFRRRIVYYLHNFDLVKKKQDYELLISNIYIYYSLLLPENELNLFKENILNSLIRGNWIHTKSKSIWNQGDLSCLVKEFDKHPEDKYAIRNYPDYYKSIDIIFRSANVGDINPKLPWEVLLKGMRQKDIRETPCEILDLSILKELYPFHVEIGCGMSVEAGVPPLHHLHDLYCVTDFKTNKFIFGGIEDTLLSRLIEKPESEIPKLGSLFSASFLAEPTNAHLALKALEKNGFLVGPVFTNNFDGLAFRAGLSEKFLRRYDETIPDIKFDNKAKSLLVIGSHADRRRIQERARNQGLKVIFLDPEGYFNNGHFSSYPIEGPKSVDFLCRKTAIEGLTNLCSILGIEL